MLLLHIICSSEHPLRKTDKMHFHFLSGLLSHCVLATSKQAICLNVLYVISMMSSIKVIFGYNTQSKYYNKAQRYILGWPKSPLSFFHKVKDTFFIFTNNVIDLGIVSMSANSCRVKHWLFSVNVSIWSISPSTGPPDRGASSSEKSQLEISQTTFDMFDQSQNLVNTLNIFLAFQLYVYLSWNNKA